MTDSAGSEDESVSRKTGKKVYYAFGTPSHSTHAYSEFAHLGVESMSFATTIAAAKDIPTEADQSPKIRRSPSTKSKTAAKAAAAAKAKLKAKVKKEKEGGGGGEEDEETRTATEEEVEVCTKIPCQIVLRQMSEIELKNEAERIELEDRYEQLVEDIEGCQSDVMVSEQRLNQLNEVSNHLEVSLTQINGRVESLEKKSTSLNEERADINSKLMLMEVEKQKCNRLLEKAQKALSDTRWKKKKETQALDAESGLSFPISQIADAKIKHMDAASVKSSLDVYKTNYNELTDVHVVDVNERPPAILTLPLPLQLDFFQPQERKVEFDKYSRKHYQKLVDHSLQSWERVQNMTLACDLKSQQLAQNSVTDALTNNSVGSPGEKSSFFGRGSTVGGGNSSVSSRVGRTLATRLTSQSANNNNIKSNNSVVGSCHKQQLLQSMHTLLKFKKQQSEQQQKQQQETSLASSSISSLDEQQQEHDEMTMRNTKTAANKLSQRTNSIHKSSKGKNKNSKKNIRLSPLTLPMAASPSSLMSISTSKGPLSLSLALHHLPLAQFEQDLLSTHEEKLENDGIYIPLPSSGYDNNSFYDSYPTAGIGKEEKKRLDGVFYSSSARTSWGRGYGHTVGVMRSLPLPNHTESSHHHHLSKTEKEQMKKLQAEEAARKANGLGKKHLVDMRLLPRLQSEVLTVKHPGMDTFSHSMSLHSSGGDDHHHSHG